MELTFSTKISKNLAELAKTSVSNYCQKHKLNCTLLSETDSGFWFWKNTTLVYKVAGDEATIKQADKQFRHTFAWV